MRDILFISKRGLLIYFEDFYCIFELVMSKNMKLQAHQVVPGQSVKVREGEGSNEGVEKTVRSHHPVSSTYLEEFMIC